VDMTNASSTYLGVVIGAIIGGIITWWVYNRQNITAKMQDETLNKITDLEQMHTKILEMHIKILERIEVVDKNHDATLQYILEVEEKVKKIVEDTDKHHKNYDNDKQ
jgi:ABC-type lipoprotein release transport system permease subunit